MPLVRIEVSGADVQSFRDALALRLQGDGTVFTPVAAVRPEARMEAVVPQALVVDVAGPDEADALLRWADEVLTAQPQGRVTFTRDGREVSVDRRGTAQARTDLESLLRS